MPAHRLALLALALGTLLLAAVPTSGQIVSTLPLGQEAQPGTTSANPGGRTGVEHYVFDASSIAPQRPIRIKAISLRPSATTQFWPFTTFPDLEIAVATIGTDWNGYAPSFASNIASSTTFFRGRSTIVNGVSTLTPAAPIWRFAHPTGHLYDPTSLQDIAITLRAYQDRTNSPLQFDAVAPAAGRSSYSAGSSGYAQSWSARDQLPIPVFEIEWEPTTGAAAHFDTGLAVGTAPFSLFFRDRSVTNGTGFTTWAWDFEADGVVDSTLQHPRHTYTQNGTYSVALTVFDPSVGSESVRRDGFVSVRPSLIADFDATPRRAPLRSTVSFTDRSTTAGSGIVSWAWDLDSDGIIDSTQQHPSFSYARVGLKSVTLIVTDPVSGSQSTTKPSFIDVYVAIYPSVTPSPTAGRPPLTVQFTGGTGTVSSAATFAWDFDDDGVVDSTQRNPSWVYKWAGVYSVTFSVSDPVYGFGTTRAPRVVRVDTTNVVNWDIRPPVGAAPLSVEFVQRTRRITQGPLTFEWDFDGDGIVDSREPEPRHVYTRPGFYVPTLRVNDPVLGSYFSRWPAYVSVGNRTWHVDAQAACLAADGSAARPYCTFDQAYNAASPGDTILIRSGVYAIWTTLLKSVRILGVDGRDRCIFDGGGSVMWILETTPREALVRTAFSLEGLTFRNPRIIRAAGCHLLLRNAAFRGLRSASASIQNGALLFLGDQVAPGSLSMVDCDFFDNRLSPDTTSYPPYGQALTAQGNGATLHLERVRMYDNASVGRPQIRLSDNVRMFADELAISGNSGDGILAYQGLVDLHRSQICGSDASALKLYSATLDARSTTISGNAAAFDASQSACISEHLTIVDNRSFGTFSSPSLVLQSSILRDSGAATVSSSTWVRYSNIRGGTGGLGNLDAAPGFVAPLTGNWTSAAVLDGTTGLVTLRDANANWTPGALRGDRIVNASGDREFVILDNTTTEIVVPVDERLHVMARAQDPYVIRSSRLLPTSPCVDVAEPFSLGSTDLRGLPRTLDGNHDGIARRDMGAEELGSVRLASLGPAVPGGTLRLAADGTPGTLAFLVFAVRPTELIMPPVSALFVDLASPHVIVPLGVLPTTTSFPIPPVVSPNRLYLQALAPHPLTVHTSNLLRFLIR